MRRVWFLLGILLAPSATVQAQAARRLVVGGGSRLWIEGASNVSKWTCRATTVSGAIGADSGFSDAGAPPSSAWSVTVRVPVSALTCGHAQMDKSLRTALRAAEGEARGDGGNIVATLEAVRPDTSDGRTVHTIGTLTLAGREHPIRVDIDTSRATADGMEAQGEIPILMSDYGVEPPTALFGVIRCTDRVVVKFAVIVAPAMTTISTAAP